MSATFSCFDFHFSIQASDMWLEGLVTDLYRSFSSHATPSVHYNVVEWSTDLGSSFAVYANTRCVQRTEDPTIALGHLIWEINQAVIESSIDAPLVHAAAAETDGHGILLPAASGSGKSTLVAGLASVGFGYLTDDVAVLDWESGRIQPYPKPIALDRALWPLFPALAEFPEPVSRYFGQRAFVSYRDIGATTGRPSTPQLIVIPRYLPGTETRLVGLTRADTLVQLAGQSFNLTRFGARSLELLSVLAADCQSYRLEYSDLHDAVGAISSLAAS